MTAGREKYVKFPLPPDFKTSLSKAYKLVTKSFVYYTYRVAAINPEFYKYL
jgi:hypothetical protein